MSSNEDDGHATITAIINIKNTSDTAHEQHSLLSLPHDVVHKILECLLKAEKVVETTADFQLQYRFDVQIMQTCRTLYDIGTSVLQLNYFILGSTTNKHMVKMMRDFGICLWLDKLRRCKIYRLRLNVAMITGRPCLDKPVFFLFCLRDVTSFVRVLRMFDLLENPQFKSNFEIKGDLTGAPLALKQQQALITPFTAFHSRRQRCVVGGLVEPQLQSHVSLTMNSTLYWKRVEVRDYVDTATFYSSLAERAADLGKFELAEGFYCSLFVFAGGTCGTIQTLHALGEQTLRRQNSGLVASIAVRKEIIKIRRAASTRSMALFQEVANNPKVALYQDCPEIQSILIEVGSIAYIWLGQLDRAQRAASIAAKLERLGLGHYLQDKIATLKAAAVKTRKDVLAHELRRVAGEAILHLPERITPFGYVEPGAGPDVIATYDQECYDLKKLGYKGDMLETSLSQAQGWSIVKGEEVNKPFSEADRDKALAPILARFAECDRQGIRRPIYEVGVATVDVSSFPMAPTIVAGIPGLGIPNPAPPPPTASDDATDDQPLPFGFNIVNVDGQHIIVSGPSAPGMVTETSTIRPCSHQE